MSLYEGPRAIVVDASVAMELLLDDAVWIARWRDWLDVDAQLLAPPHFRVEVADALLRGARQTASMTALRLERLFGAGVEIDDPGLDGLLEAVVVAERHALSVYDAVHLQLALDMDAELATQDCSLARAAQVEGLVVHG